MRPSTIFLSALLLSTPVQVIAQDPLTDPVVADSRAEGDWSDNPRLGLLGLLGLVGLLGLMRREPSIRERYVLAMQDSERHVSR